MSRLLVLSVACWLWAGVASAADEPVTPKESVPLFNGKDLAGFTTWLKDANPFETVPWEEALDRCNNLASGSDRTNPTTCSRRT